MAFKNAFALFAVLYIAPLTAAFEEPWGKDADLVLHAKTSQTINQNELAGFDSLIEFHQQVLSQADGPRSHFVPSSSEYMRRAAKKYGLFTGFCLGCDRLMRENSEKWLYPLYKTRDGDYLKRDPTPLKHL